ncbi:MAG: NAD(P)H-dependent oxidoreductase subunit E [Desulfococcaceae bacterium]
MDSEASREEAALLNRLRAGLTDFEKDRTNLLPILRMIQETLSYIPEEAIHMAADHLDMAPSEIFGVATFYNQFKFNPPGKYPIKVCLGTACHVKGGDIILENFERKLDIREGETTPDRDFSLERVACVGCCALAPVALVGEAVYGHMAPSKVEGLFTRIQVEKEMAEREKRRHESAR